MLQWATEFPAAPETTPEAFLAIAKKWLQGSPHLGWKGYKFADSPPDDQILYNHNGQTATAVRVTTAAGSWAGFEHSWVDGERQWTTQLVGHKSLDGFLVSVRLDCALLKPTAVLPKAKKPYSIKLVFDLLGGGTDGLLTVQDKPHFLAENQVDDAASMLTGRSGGRLPIVYLSSPHRGIPRLDASALAKDLGGLAHVVVEPSKYFSFALARRASSQNPYGGSVGIVWPHAAGQLMKIRPFQGSTAAEVQVAVGEHVRSSLTMVRPSSEVTWSYLSQALSQVRIAALKASGSQSVDDYIEAFDRDMEAQAKQLDEANHEIGRLNAEIRRLSSGSKQAGLLKAGKEVEYFPGELADTIAASLQIASRNLGGGSRRRHLVDDLIAANPATGASADIVDDIKNAFETDGGLGNGQRRLLEDLGFTITEDGKHYKAVYRDDGRYTFTIAKTPSDHRAGRNLAGEINRTLFR
ncbi:MAG: hypothetical protein IPI92_10040 [Gemmatimonadetes bacterium]|nr:hypothetical protein [Gemmatimonadota bacterium]